MEVRVLRLSVTCSLQVKGGETGLYDGAEVVLGPDSGLMEPGPEQQFINQKMRPGSGVLSVQVLPDGPTRVLQVRTNPVELQRNNNVSDSGDAEQLRIFEVSLFCPLSLHLFYIIAGVLPAFQVASGFFSQENILIKADIDQ